MPSTSSTSTSSRGRSVNEKPMSALPEAETAHHKALLQSRVVVLLGAGASAPLGMPTMDRFKDVADCLQVQEGQGQQMKG